MNEVKEKLTELIEQAERKNPDCGIFPYILAEELAQNGATIQEWVSVDEPPKEDGRYLVFSEYEEGTGMADALYEKDRGEFGDYAWYWSEARGEYKVWVEFKYVTHWMTLPEPPKGVQ